MSTSVNRTAAADVKIGDVIMFGGGSHLVTTIDPYNHPTIGDTHGIAKAADGWGITLLEGVTFEVAR